MCSFDLLILFLVRMGIDFFLYFHLGFFLFFSHMESDVSALFFFPLDFCISTVEMEMGFVVLF